MLNIEQSFPETDLYTLEEIQKPHYFKEKRYPYCFCDHCYLVCFLDHYHIFTFPDMIFIVRLIYFCIYLVSFY